jgi:hypothetical protein
MTDNEHPYSTEDFVGIEVLEDPFEAQLIEPVLEAENIPHRIRSYHDTAYDGLFQAQRGWGEIFAPESFAPQIRDILSDLRTDRAAEGEAEAGE